MLLPFHSVPKLPFEYVDTYVERVFLLASHLCSVWCGVVWGEWERARGRGEGEEGEEEEAEKETRRSEEGPVFGEDVQLTFGGDHQGGDDVWLAVEVSRLDKLTNVMGEGQGFRVGQLRGHRKNLTINDEDRARHGSRTRGWM